MNLNSDTIDKAKNWISYNCCPVCKNQDECGADTECFVLNAYIEGIKQNKTNWHNLKENPNDLPQDFKYKRIYINGCYDKAYYQANHDTWYGDNARYSTHAVTAWCDFDFFEEDD